jgi:hypothetical protein
MVSCPHVFFPPPLRPRFQPKNIRNNQANRNHRHANYHQPTVALLLAVFLGLLRGAGGALGGGFW